MAYHKTHINVNKSWWINAKKEHPMPKNQTHKAWQEKADPDYVSVDYSKCDHQLWNLGAETPTDIRFNFCPWCGKDLRKEAK